MTPEPEISAHAPSSVETLARALKGKLAPEPDWLDLVRTANEEFVAPSLYRALNTPGLRDRAEDEAFTFLCELDRANQARNANLWSLTKDVVATCNSKGITPTLVKGASDLALAQDPSLFERILIDVDVLVPAGSVDAATAALLDAGYEILEDTTFGHSPGCFWRQGFVGGADLHSELPPRLAELLDATDRDARFNTVERDGITFRVPDISARILINIGHDLLHHSGLMSGATSLRYLLDLAHKTEQSGDEIDWQWLVGKRENKGFRIAFDLQMRMIAHLFGIAPKNLPEPDGFVRALHRRRLLKAKYRTAGEIEWRVVKMTMALARRAKRRAS